MKPLIGITATKSVQSGQISCTQTYVNAVLQAGGAPIVIPHMDDVAAIQSIVHRLDGIIMTGGGDFDPSYYEITHPPAGLLQHPDPPRDFFDFTIGNIALEKELPFLGICRGMQWLNVLHGGSLHMDLEYSQLPYAHHLSDENRPQHGLIHAVDILPNSQLHEITQSLRFEVNSRHHQAVNQLGQHLIVSATAEDGHVIEAIERPDRPFVIGVQWHPEDLATNNNPAAQRLFVALVQAAKK